MTKAAKIIEALQVELAAAIETKNAANDAMDADRFYAACARVKDIEAEIVLAGRGKSKTCSITKELVGNNVD